MSTKKEEIQKIGEKIKIGRRSYIDEIAEKSSEGKVKHKKVTLSLPEDVVKMLWRMKADMGYPSISRIVSEAVKEFAQNRNFNA